MIKFCFGYFSIRTLFDTIARASERILARDFEDRKENVGVTTHHKLKVLRRFTCLSKYSHNNVKAIKSNIRCH